MIETHAQAREAFHAGQHWIGYLRRGGPAMTAGVYADLSYAAGIPAANYYASTPKAAAVLSGRDGIDLGPEPAAGLTKYLRRVMILPPTATGILTFQFLDICLYYPFVDGDGGFQEMVNAVAIPRYDGEGCRIMVVSQGIGTGYAEVRVTYTNSDGVPGRQVTASLNLAAAAGSLCSSVPSNVAAATAPNPCGPFLPLASGDTGVRSIESVEPLTAAGGVQAFVIVKPLLAMGMAEVTVAPVEVDLLADRSCKLAELGPGAYLSAIAIGTVTASPATITAETETLWG